MKYDDKMTGYSLLTTEKIGAHLYRLTKDFINPYQTVPKGFEFDGASVPRILWALLDPFGEAAEAAAVHDYLYVTTLKDKQYADKIFREILLDYGVDEKIAELAYRAVRRFGKGNY